MLTGNGKTDTLKSMFLAHGLKGQTASSLSITEQVMVVEHLRKAGFVSESELQSAYESRLALLKVLRTRWPNYLKVFVGLYPETDRKV